MSAIADAFIVAMDRAFPDLDNTGRDDLEERFFSDRATPQEAEAINREFAKVTRADIGRPPLPGGET